MITTDQGKEFRNELNKQLTDSFGIKHRLTTAYHPQVTDELTESFRQMLLLKLHFLLGQWIG